MKYITVKFFPPTRSYFLNKFRIIIFGPLVKSGYVIMNIELQCHIITEAAICCGSL
jgi:hypothetical protein